jgi:hypothetical protein
MPLSRFRPRFTVRRMMVIVAVAGLTMAAIHMGHRRSYFLGKYGEHQKLASRWADEKDYAERRFSLLASRKLFSDETRQSFKDYVLKAGALLDYHQRLASNYHQAVCYPWRRVDSDPPSPREPDYLPEVFICN